MKGSVAKPAIEGKVHPLIDLAREAVDTYLRRRKVITPTDLTAEMQERAGVFVCLKVRGQLRGCIGTIEPTRPNVAEEVVLNAIRAATRDPRFLPVDEEELPLLSYSIDVLEPAEPIEDLSQLDTSRYGVIVEGALPPPNRRGLLLPALEGVDTPAEQVAIARRKAGIGPDQPVKLYRFSVRRYE